MILTHEPTVTSTNFNVQHVPTQQPKTERSMVESIKHTQQLANTDDCATFHVLIDSVIVQMRSYTMHCIVDRRSDHTDAQT